MGIRGGKWIIYGHQKTVQVDFMVYGFLNQKLM